MSIDAIKFFDQCIFLTSEFQSEFLYKNSPDNTLTPQKKAHLHNNEDICPSRGINLLLISAVSPHLCTVCPKGKITTVQKLVSAFKVLSP